MKKLIAIMLLCLAATPLLRAELTIEECVAKAEANYPLVSKYRLLEATRDVDLSDINKSWLPRIGLYAQATAQNVVPSFPEALTGVLDQMGQEVRGLGKIQYKAGADISQTIWDGGVARARRDAAQSQERLGRSSLDVEMHALRGRVENTFFATLLTEQQTAQSEETRRLLEANLGRLRSMLENGTAMQSDVDMVEAQYLTLGQEIARARSAARGYRRVLSLLTGEDMSDIPLARPAATLPSPDAVPARPELRLFDARLEADSASRRLADTSLMPRVGLFAQAWYGYPGLDYFDSMMRRRLSLNLVAGIKISWNIDALYTRGNTARKSALNTAGINADRDLFLFNTRLTTASQREAIEGLREEMKDDSRIVALRADVRRAAESQLANGVIDATALLAKISDENIAMLTAQYHEIQLLQEIYKLKQTLNR